MNKKVLASLGLAVALVATSMPAFAYDYMDDVQYDGTNSKAEVHATADITKNVDAESCQVYAEVGSQFTVTIPKAITLSGADRSGEYTVSVKGDIAGNEYVSVTPESEFEMKQAGKEDVIATITQEVVNFRGYNYKEDLTGVADTVLMNNLEGTGGESATGSISAKDLTAGAWNGTFNFAIALNEDATN